MECLLPIINDLQVIFKKTGMKELELPQIVVVGAQSCGKSSVLESLVGKSFLPRGTGIVTRCPTILQLHQIQQGEQDYFELQVEGNEEGDDNQWEKYTDSDVLQQAIQNATNEMAGSNKGITAEPIFVRVWSSNVVSLTVVDLPGIVKVPIGDQPQDIEEQVLEMIHQYISNPNSIILAVCPGNVDMANSESLKIAKGVDPNGERTLAVITKLDLLDKGVTATKELNGFVIPVKLGIIGVINRSQQDLMENKSVVQAHHDEIAKLEADYPTLAGRIGSAYLGMRLNELLLEHIKKCIPDLKKRILELTEQQQKQLKLYGLELPENTFEKMRIMIEIIQNFETEYKKCIEDRSGVNTIESDTTESVGSKIAQANSNYISKMREIQALKDLDDEDIETLIKRTSNWESIVSIEEVFKALAKRQILLLMPPCTSYIQTMLQILQDTVKPCLSDQRVAKLNSEIQCFVRRLFEKSFVDMKELVNEMFEELLIMTFTTDKEFNELLRNPGRRANSTTVVEKAVAAEPTFPGVSFPGLQSPVIRDLVSFPLANEEGGINQDQLDYIKLLVRTYFDSIRRTIMDSFPKRTLYRMYHRTMETFKSSFVQSISGKVNEVIVEPESIVLARKRCEGLLKSLDTANDVVNRIQDTQIYG